MDPPERGNAQGASQPLAFWPHLDREIKRLKKKYPNVEQDITEALNDLESPTIRKDPVPSYHGRLLKVRVRSSDMKRGARGGFRILLYGVSNPAPQPPTWYPVTVYAKTEREDLPKDQVKDLLRRFFEWLAQMPGSSNRE